MNTTATVTKHNGPCSERRAWAAREGLALDYQCNPGGRYGCRCECHKAKEAAR